MYLAYSRTPSLSSTSRIISPGLGARYGLLTFCLAGRNGTDLFADEARQVDLHRSAAPLLAVDAHVSAGLLDEAVHHGKPKPRPLPGRLGGEKRLEHLVEDILRDPRPGIGDAEHRVLPGLDVAEPAHIGVVEIGVGRLDGQAAAVRHGGFGVERKIEQNVLELMAVGKRRPQAGAEHGLDADVRSERAAEHLE